MKMMNAILGCFFIFIAAFFYATKHITAAIMTSYINSPDVNYFEGGYQSIGVGITIWTVLSLLLGIYFLFSDVWRSLLKVKHRTND